ncbi:MAG: YwiC-like family protein [Blastocatellia bacterium]
MKVRATLRLPREHGAWAMLYVPFVVGALVAAEINLRVVCLFFSTSFLFIARESLLVWWRARRRGQSQAAALKMLIVYASLAGLFGLPLVAVYKLYWLVPLGAAIAGLLLYNAEQATRREDRTITGEVLAILGMTLTAPATYYATRGALDVTALWLWALCALYFTSSVFYVKLRVHWLNKRKADQRRQSWRRCAIYHGSLLAALATFAATGNLSLLTLVAFAPVLGRSFWHLARPVEKINLKRIGVTEIIYSLVFLVFITLTFRLA